MTASMAAAPRENAARKRRKHKKSHLGCANCKNRRVKCDEQLPECGQCVKYKAECSYLSMTPEELSELRKIKQMVAQMENAGVPVSPPNSGSSSSPASIHRNGSATSMGNTPTEEKPFIVQQGFETDMLRNLYVEWMSWLFGLAADNSILYDAIMAFSYGFMAIKTGKESYRLNSDVHRALALEMLQQEIAKENITNSDCVLATALILSWDIFLQQEDIQSYVTLTRGVAAVLEKIELTNAQTGMALCMRDAIVQGIKSIRMPPYNPEFVTELLANIQGIRDYIASSNHLTLISEHAALVHFVAEVMLFLQSNNRQCDSAGTCYFAPQLLFKMLRQWLQLFPSAALSRNGLQGPQQQTVLYLYYHAVTRVLDALFPEVRYIFQFGFIGPVDLVGVENLVNEPVYAQLDGYLPIDDYSHLVRYPLKVLTFFKERLLKLNNLLVAATPLERSSEQIMETCIVAFENVVISQEHFPSLVQPSYPSAFDPFPPVVTPPSENEFDRKGDFFQAYFTDRMEILQSVSIY